MRSRLAVALVAAVVATAAVAPAAAGASTGVAPGAADASTADDPTPSLVVDLRADGSATVTLVQTYDLETDDERAAFESLQVDQQAREEARSRFADRMAAVAADASAATGREMSVSDAAIDLRTTDSVGVVELSVTWTNLAAERDGRLVVTEPFASGFEPDRQFTVIGPDGYELDGATPAADESGENSATWSAGTDLSGFQVAFAPADGGSGGGGERVPGFGIGVALIALVTVALLARR